MMSRFAMSLFSCVITTALVCGGTALMAAPASKDDKAALKQAIVACKAEAKGKKVKWLSRRKYVKQCVIEALKDRPSINVDQMLKDHPEMKDLPKEEFDAT